MMRCHVYLLLAAAFTMGFVQGKRIQKTTEDITVDTQGETADTELPENVTYLFLDAPANEEKDIDAAKSITFGGQTFKCCCKKAGECKLQDIATAGWTMGKKYGCSNLAGWGYQSYEKVPGGCVVDKVDADKLGHTTTSTITTTTTVTTTTSTTITTTSSSASPDVTDVFDAAGGRVTIGDKTYKCCCRSSGECALADIEAPGKTFVYRDDEGCGHLKGWLYKNYESQKTKRCVLPAADALRVLATVVTSTQPGPEVLDPSEVSGESNAGQEETMDVETVDLETPQKTNEEKGMEAVERFLAARLAADVDGAQAEVSNSFKAIVMGAERPSDFGEPLIAPKAITKELAPVPGKPGVFVQEAKYTKGFVTFTLRMTFTVTEDFKISGLTIDKL